MIIIVDYGMGNLGSVVNMFKKIGVKSEVVSDIERIRDASKILLPGVGAFDAAVERIDNGGFRDVLNQKALVDKVPVLGICLGMQLLTERSDEGDLSGLGWIKANTNKFNFDQTQKLKIPHMGWNFVNKANSSPLTDSLPDDSRFYFVHSYYVKCERREDSLMKTNYGLEFDSVITNGSNIFGAQFHPEKSHKYGMELFRNFAAI